VSLMAESDHSRMLCFSRPYNISFDMVDNISLIMVLKPDSQLAFDKTDLTIT
jgi:hypothetical protein